MSYPYGLTKKHVLNKKTWARQMKNSHKWTTICMTARYSLKWKTGNILCFVLSSALPLGKCPEPGMGICIESCTADTSCENGQLCCSNGCGHVCMDPVVGEFYTSYYLVTDLCIVDNIWMSLWFTDVCIM